MVRRTTYGVTLIEMMVVLTISVLALSLAAPALDHIMARTKTTSAVNRLVGAVNLTRHTAVAFQTMATLCPLKTNGRCGGSWNATLTVFLDRNQNAWLEEEDTVINRISPVSDGTQVYWRAFQNKPYLQMTPWGYTNFQNGNFVICDESDSVKQAKQLVINIQGRTRINRRVNSQGWPVDRRGKLLRC